MQQSTQSAGNEETKLPVLSIIITIVSGANHLISCLSALSEQKNCILDKLEIIVPYDERDQDISKLKESYPDVLFHPIVLTVQGPAGKCHEHFDELRATGIHLATGKIIAILEDHEKPKSDWCSKILEVHQQPYAAVGGAVENGINKPINWATYFFDFGRYQNPVIEGPSPFITDVNVAYKREALYEVRHAWENGFHEPAVHGALLERGDVLWLCPEIIVYQNRSGLTFSNVLQERFIWGRYFAGNRFKEVGLPKRIVYSVLSLSVPGLILLKMSRNAISKRRLLGVFIKVLPTILLLSLFWFFGEFTGYITGRASSFVKS